jgi:hypothetical protein
MCYVNIYQVKKYSVTKKVSNPRLIGKCRYISGYSSTRFWVEVGVSGQVFSWADLRPEKGFVVRIESDAGWAPQAVFAHHGMERSRARVWNRTTVSQLYSTFDYTLYRPLSQTSLRLRIVRCHRYNGFVPFPECRPLNERRTVMTRTSTLCQQWTAAVVLICTAT